MVMLLIVIAAYWLFLKVAVFVVLATFTTWLLNDIAEGLKVVCANAEEPETRRYTVATIPLQNDFLPYLACPVLRLLKELESKKQLEIPIW